MPDDYQTLLGELGGDVAPAADIAPDVVDDVVEDTLEDPNSNNVGVAEETEATTDPAIVEESETPEEQPEVADTGVDVRNQAFAAMRSQNTKYQKAFARIAEAMGAESEDEVIEQLIGASYAVQGQRENVDPVILRRIADLEEKNTVLDAATRQQYVRDSFDAVQKQLSLTDQELIVFAQKLTDQNVDIFSTNVPLSVLYTGMNHETMLKKKLEAEKQSWIKGQAEADKAPGVSPATGKPVNKEVKEITTEADLDLVLKSLSK